jgi:glycosyltransferase involved in cell wall biosynthesis
MSQRKGLADVFAAMRLLNRSDLELVVMGSPLMPLSFYRSQFADFVYEPGRPHEEVLKLMATCDVLVLPSLVEGRALVQQEALACGLPIVVTRNAGGEDLIDEGRTGFLVPVRSPESVAGKLAWLADHRDAVEGMRDACVRKAAECSWTAYAAGIIDLIAKQCSRGERNGAFVSA